MNVRLWLILLTLLAVTGPGCSHRPKQSPVIAGDVEEDFKQRWIAKRMSELQAGGVTDAREARVKATEEFRKRYEFINSSGRSDPMSGRP